MQKLDGIHKGQEFTMGMGDAKVKRGPCWDNASPFESMNVVGTTYPVLEIEDVEFCSQLLENRELKPNIH